MNNHETKQKNQVEELSNDEMRTIAGGLQLTTQNTLRDDLKDPFSKEFAIWESWNRCDGDCGWD